MSKAKSLGQSSFIGQEIPGDDMSADFDPMQSEHAETPLDDLDRLIEKDMVTYSEAEDRRAGVQQEQDEPVSEDGPEDEGEEPQEAEAQEEAEDSREAKPESSEEGAEEPEEATEEAPDFGDRISTLERQLEMARLESEKVAADTDRWRLIAERESARAGNLQQKLRTSFEPEDSYSPEYEDRRPQRQQNGNGQLDDQGAILQELNVRAMQDVQSEFLKEAESFIEGLKDQNGASEAFAEDVRKGVLEHQDELRDAATRGRPRAAATLTRSVLRSVMADAKIKLLQRQEQHARDVKAQQRSSSRAKKLAASGVKASAVPAKGVKGRGPSYDPKSIPLDEFDRRLDQELGTNRDAGSEMF